MGPRVCLLPSLSVLKQKDWPILGGPRVCLLLYPNPKEFAYGTTGLPSALSICTKTQRSLAYPWGTPGLPSTILKPTKKPMGPRICLLPSLSVLKQKEA